MGNKLDISARNDKATTKMLRLNVLSTQVTKTVDEQNELSSLQNELSDYIISANDINAIAQASDLTTTNNNIGTLSSLTTNDKTSLVSAANEVESRALATRSLQREIAELKLVSSIKNRVDGASNIFYDDFSGSVAGSIAQLDTYKSNFTGTLSVGATSGTVTSVVGLSIGREVTIQDVTTEATRERVIISNIVGNVVSFATPLVHAYVTNSLIYRSISVVDTVNKRLKFSTSPILLTQEDNRYNIVPSSSMKSIVQWVDRNILTGFSTTSLASIVASGVNESFASMTKKTTTIDGLTEEDQFSYTASSANTKITIRNTMNRASTSDVVYETQMSGAVSL